MCRIKKLAILNFKNHFSCSESVFLAANDSGLIKVLSDYKGLSCGFGGGIGLSGYTCGALNGAILALSFVCGKDPLAMSVRERARYRQDVIYRLFNSLLYKFQHKAGAVLCRDLTKSYVFNSYERQEMCTEIVGIAAQLVEEHINLWESGKVTEIGYDANMLDLK